MNAALIVLMLAEVNRSRFKIVKASVNTAARANVERECKIKSMLIYYAEKLIKQQTFRFEITIRIFESQPSSFQGILYQK